MDPWRDIFNVAIHTYEQNQQEYQEQLAQEQADKQLKELAEKEKRTTPRLKADPKQEAYSKELYDLIQSHGFQIDYYEKMIEFEPDDYEPTLEIYYCSSGNWNFTIEHISDVDITEGIFAVRSLTHKFTQEAVLYYCDLGCRNTGTNRLHLLLEFFTYESLQQYIDTHYAPYLLLPALLQKYGYVVQPHQFQFGLGESQGFLCIDTDLRLSLVEDEQGLFKLKITSMDKGKSALLYTSSEDLSYEVSYQDAEEIKECIACIEAFKQHQNGEIGYWEEEDQTYYSNDAIQHFFQQLKDAKDPYKPVWNTHQIRIEHKMPWGYSPGKKLNKYKGIELYTETLLTFNDAYQWSKGSKANQSLIKVEFNRNKSDKCRLTIENTLYQVFDRSEEEFIARIEQEGSFKEVFQQLKTYVYRMIDIHQLTL